MLHSPWHSLPPRVSQRSSPRLAPRWSFKSQVILHSALKLLVTTVPWALPWAVLHFFRCFAPEFFADSRTRSLSKSVAVCYSTTSSIFKSLYRSTAKRGGRAETDFQIEGDIITCLAHRLTLVSYEHLQLFHGKLPLFPHIFNSNLGADLSYHLFWGGENSTPRQDCSWDLCARKLTLGQLATRPKG
jgi:hypothetical protein